MNLIRNQEGQCPICMAAAEQQEAKWGSTYGPPNYGMSSGGLLDPGSEEAWSRIGIVPTGEEPPAAGQIPPMGQTPDLTPGVGNCFGTASAQYLDQIKGLIDGELVFRQALLTLGERNGPMAPLLRNAAAESLESARKLAAAHYLINGQFYWPERINLPAQNQDFAFELRRQFTIARDMESDYRMIAGDVWDRCLGNLYALLADTKVGQISRLFSVLGSF